MTTMTTMTSTLLQVKNGLQHAPAVSTLSATAQSECLQNIKHKIENWVETKIIKGEMTKTKPGSISYLFYGEKPSKQSINIKLGRSGEYLSKELVASNPQLELLKCGIQQIENRKIDVDLLFRNRETNVVYYRELKANIELDTEKLPATIQKCHSIQKFIAEKYEGCEVDVGILNWSVYDRKCLTAGISNIKAFEKENVKIEHMGDFLKIVCVDWEETDYYGFFRALGDKISATFV